MRILNFGSMNLDYVYKVPHFVMPGETLAATEQVIYPGGKGLNQSIAIARAGSEVFHAGAVGLGGESLVALLDENGVDTTYLKTVDSLQGNAIIQINTEGQNCILLYGGSNHMVTRTHIDETLVHFGPGDYLVLQNEISNIPYLIERATSLGMRIVLNPSPFDQAMRSVNFETITWLFINEVEGCQITGETDPIAIGKVLGSSYPALQVVLTLGSRGAMAFSHGETLYQPVFDVKVVDTTAAGDTFTGYFLSALVLGESISDCLQRASKASSISVSRPGASVSIPTAAEVDAADLYEINV